MTQDADEYTTARSAGRDGLAAVAIIVVAVVLIVVVVASLI